MSGRFMRTLRNLDNYSVNFSSQISGIVTGVTKFGRSFSIRLLPKTKREEVSRSVWLEGFISQ